MKFNAVTIARKKQAGFTFVELAIALMVMALLIGSVSIAYTSSFESISRREGIEHAKTVQASIRAYALRNGRLPCPAVNAGGYESVVSGVCTTGLQVGYVPYVSLGLLPPGDAHLAAYAVYRLPNSTPSLDRDLTSRLERTSDAAGSANYSNASDLIFALLEIDTATTSASHPYMTGDEGAAGLNNCATNQFSQVAYWINVPLTDANSDGSRFDASNSTSNLCATSALAAPNAQFDDIVLLETPLELAGWLRARIRP
jgi:prepilin-type N-terminal cleavage/methylation domain-containing protein